MPKTPPKRPILVPVAQELTVLPSRDGKTSYRVEQLKNIYVVSGDTPEQFVARFNLHFDVIESIIVKDNWDLHRSQHRDYSFQVISDTLVANLYKSIENELFQQAMMNAHMEVLQREATEYFTTHGDFYVRQKAADGKLARNSEGKTIIVEDIYGERLEIQAFRKLKRKDDMRKSHEYLQGLYKLLQAAMEANPTAPTTGTGLFGPQPGKVSESTDLTIFGFKPKK